MAAFYPNEDQPNEAAAPGRVIWPLTLERAASSIDMASDD